MKNNYILAVVMTIVVVVGAIALGRYTGSTLRLTGNIAMTGQAQSPFEAVEAARNAYRQAAQQMQSMEAVRDALVQGWVEQEKNWGAPTPLLTVQNLKVTDVYPSHQIRFAWDPVSNAKFYQILYGTSVTGKRYFSRATIDSTPSVIIDLLQPNTTYYACVRALDSLGLNPGEVAGCSNEVVAVTLPVVQNVKITNVTSDSVSLSWTASPNALVKRYLVDYKNAPDAKTSNTRDVGLNTSPIVTGLAPNTVYYMQIWGETTDGKNLGGSELLMATTLAEYSMAPYNTSSSEVCGDGLDNDSDGQPDCFDTDCSPPDGQVYRADHYCTLRDNVPVCCGYWSEKTYEFVPNFNAATQCKGAGRFPVKDQAMCHAVMTGSYGVSPKGQTTGQAVMMLNPQQQTVLQNGVNTLIRFTLFANQVEASVGRFEASVTPSQPSIHVGGFELYRAGNLIASNSTSPTFTLSAPEALKTGEKVGYEIRATVSYVSPGTFVQTLFSQEQQTAMGLKSSSGYVYRLMAPAK